MDVDYETLVFDIKLEDILVREENNEEHIKIDDIKMECFEFEETMTEANKEHIKEEPIDIKDECLQTEDLKTEYVPDISFNQPDMKTENGPGPFLNSSDHLYVKTQDGPYLNSLEHDHCYLRKMVSRDTRVKMVQQIRSPFMAKDIFRASGESFNGLMTRLEPKERNEILARKARLPCRAVDIINSPRDSFNELLTQPELSPEQIKVCQDIRRRGKNNVAARNCRKRKMDTIDELQSQVDQVDLLVLTTLNRNLMPHNQFQLEDKKEELMRAKEKLVIEREVWRQRLSNLEEVVMSRLGSSSQVLEVIAR